MSEKQKQKPILSLRYKIKKRNGKPRQISTHPIELYPDQIEHKNRLLQILQKSPFAFDFSMLGTGKTYTSSAVYQELGLPYLITIVPKSVKAKWQYMEEYHGIEQVAQISYCELRSIKLKQPKHGLLVRTDSTYTMKKADGTKVEVEQCSFKPTNYYQSLVNDGVLLVIDEIQNVKNVSDQLLACRSLINQIVADFKYGGKSRVLLLSGSPIDKQVQVIHLYRCVGIMCSERLRRYDGYTGEYIEEGIKEIKDYLRLNFTNSYRDYNKQYYLRNIWDLYDNKIKGLEKQCYSWFQQIIKPELSSVMKPRKIDCKITKQNAFYHLLPDDLALLKKGVQMLELATNYDSHSNTINHGHNGVEALMNIQRALVMIETSKINLLVRITRQHLAKYPTSKVVICVNYTDTIEDLMTRLEDYQPLKLNGCISTKNRYQILQQFQHPSTKHRLLIGNITVCSSGIDLDDQHGGYPRFCLVNPNYSAISLYQLGHRFHRSNTKSDATVHFVLGQNCQNELPILDALSLKGEVMKETTHEQSEYGILFPGEYPEWYEN